MGNVLYAVEESALAGTFDALVCGDDCKHQEAHDGNLWYYRLTYEERKDLRERATRALAASRMARGQRNILIAVVERYKGGKQA